MKKFLQEFKTFAMRGNVMDLAVGVIVGGAFSSITNSLVLNFVILAFVVFCMVKAVNRVAHTQKKEEAPPPAPSHEEKLLTEIRDLLKERK